MTYRVLIQNEAEFAGDLDFITRAGQYVLKQQNAPEGDLTVALVDGSRMRTLNRKFADMDRPTDVLAFPHHEINAESERMYLGDVAICLGVARAQAEQAGHSLQSELMLLTVHGILHVLGHDHQDDEDSRRMFSLQEGLLKALADSEETGR
jgi:probable rRNA maturation factor